VIVLDTHALLWSQFEAQKLGRKTRALIEKHWLRGEVGIPSIAFWEAGMLVERRRIQLQESLREWRARLVDGGAIELPINSEVAIRATEIVGLHPDPADRLIVATTLAHGGLLVTADEKLLAWRHPFERHDART